LQGKQKADDGGDEKSVSRDVELSYLGSEWNVVIFDVDLEPNQKDDGSNATV
jgi:hypothetical protein